jgi:raffinose synthase
MHGALNESVERHFPEGSVINCMCHSTDNIYHFGDSSMCRASDDFFPRNAASWTSHIVAVAYNSLFFGEIVNPDWDMFHTQHPAAGLHAAARAVGGCAVYVSDAPGKHDAELLRRLVLPSGAVLRALLPGRPTADCLFADVARDGRTALKVWNRNATGGVLGLFNVQGSFWDSAAHQYVRVPRRCVPVEARVCAIDVPGFGTPGPSGKYPPGDYALYCHARRSLSVLPSRTALTLELAPAGWEVVTVVPVKRPSGRTGPAFAAIGLGGMLDGARHAARRRHVCGVRQRRAAPRLPRRGRRPLQRAPLRVAAQGGRRAARVCAGGCGAECDRAHARERPRRCVRIAHPR